LPRTVAFSFRSGATGVAHRTALHILVVRSLSTSSRLATIGTAQNRRELLAVGVTPSLQPPSSPPPVPDCLPVPPKSVTFACPRASGHMIFFRPLSCLQSRPACGSTSTSRRTCVNYSALSAAWNRQSWMDAVVVAVAVESDSGGHDTMVE